MKANKPQRVVSRGMLNVKGLDLEDDDESGGIQLRSSEYKMKKTKKKCC